MRDWIFTFNPILNATDNNYLHSLRISTYHDNMLSANIADADILAMYTKYHPLHVNFVSGYNAWKSLGGTQQGKSRKLNQMLAVLSNSKISDWDIQIQSVYKKHTPEYKELFPNYRKPFQSGPQIKRITVVKSLNTKLSKYTLLANVKADVADFSIQLDDAYNTQKSAIGSAKTQKDIVEEARVAFCVGQYGNLGLLMNKYAETPEKILAYFDLENIRSYQQAVFTGRIKAGATITIAKHTFKTGDEIYLENYSPVGLQFYLAANKNGLPGPKCYILANSNVTVDIAELGDISNAYLMVYNPDKVIAGEYRVELV